MVTFNIRETGNELLKVLEDVPQSSFEYRLTIDVLIPDLLKGDKDGLCKSIARICRCLRSKLQNVLVNIELSKVSRSGEVLNVKIDIKAISYHRESTQQPLLLHRMDVDWLLASLAYPTTFSANESIVSFGFSMIFVEETSSTNRAKEISGKKILLVEGDDMTALIFTSFMEEWECIVTRVSNGASAVDTAKLSLHDIILMDVNLAIMSGAEAIQNIRKFDKKTPIIALATSTAEGSFRGGSIGATDVLIKPVDGEDLQRMLWRYS
jgi:CheY-like chemotaxis protein